MTLPRRTINKNEGLAPETIRCILGISDGNEDSGSDGHDNRDICPIAGISRQAAAGGYKHVAEAAVRICENCPGRKTRACFPVMKRFPAVRRDPKRCILFDIINKARNANIQGGNYMVNAALADCLDIQKNFKNLDECWKDCFDIIRLLGQFHGIYSVETMLRGCHKRSLRGNGVEDILPDGLKVQKCMECRYR
jgi:hypothetical protein